MPLDGTTYEEIVAPPTKAPTNPVADLLRRARAVIERPEHWCQGATTRFDGHLTTSYCSWGRSGRSERAVLERPTWRAERSGAPWSRCPSPHGTTPIPTLRC